jgi:hypothetical protein
LAEACPENSKTGLEVIEAAVYRNLRQSGGPNLEEDLEEIEAVVECRNSIVKRSKWTLLGHWRTNTWMNNWLYNVTNGGRSGPKEMVGSSRRWLSPENIRCTKPTLQCAKLLELISEMNKSKNQSKPCL